MFNYKSLISETINELLYDLSLLESVLPTIDQSKELLLKHKYTNNPKEAYKLAIKIGQSDPYPDKRMSPAITNWLINKHIQSPDEHRYDIEEYKKLKKKLKKLRVPATNQDLKQKVQLLNKFDPTIATNPYLIQQWNQEVKFLVDPSKNLSDEALDRVKEHKDGNDRFILYRIDKEEDLEVPIVKNLMSWCVTKDYFGEYGGPPYYPIVQYMSNGEIKPFAMIIPAYFDEDPDEAVRNSCNTGRISNKDLSRVRPLVQEVLPRDKYNHDYIKGIYGDKFTGDVNNLSPYEALDIIKNYAKEYGEWPEAENVIKQDPEVAYYYAKNVIKGRWPEAENVIKQDPQFALNYAKDVIKGRWPEVENIIKQDPQAALNYAKDVIKGRWPEAENIIKQDPQAAYYYARDVIKGRWLEAEDIIKQYPGFAYYYTREFIKGRWPEAEPYIIKKGPDVAYYYARDVIKGRWPEAENVIKQDPRRAYYYAREFIKGRWPEAEPYIMKKSPFHWNNYKKHFNIDE